jgi:hypothetical protein
MGITVIFRLQLIAGYGQLFYEKIGQMPGKQHRKMQHKSES